MHLEARAVVEPPTTTLTWSVRLKPFISISLWISKPYHLVFQTHNLVSSVEAISYPYHCGYPNHVISPSYLSQPLLGQFSWNHIISMLGISKPYHIKVVQTHNLVSSVKTISYPYHCGYPNHIKSYHGCPNASIVGSWNECKLTLTRFTLKGHSNASVRSINCVLYKG